MSAPALVFPVQLPGANIIFDPNVTTAITTCDAGTNTWNTMVPLSYTGKVFISGAMPPAAEGLDRGLNPVAWTAQ